MSQKETREAMKAIDRSGCKTCPAHLTAFCDICFRETVKTFKQGVEHERARLRKELYMNEIAYKEEPEVALIYKPNMTITRTDMEKYKIFGIQPLTPDQVRERLLQIAQDYDQEEGHIQADDAICGLLLHLGYEDIVENYCKLPKWYA